MLEYRKRARLLNDRARAQATRPIYLKMSQPTIPTGIAAFAAQARGFDHMKSLKIRAAAKAASSPFAASTAWLTPASVPRRPAQTVMPIETPTLEECDRTDRLILEEELACYKALPLQERQNIQHGDQLLDFWDVSAVFPSHLDSISLRLTVPFL